MSYIFSGFFVAPPADIRPSVTARWPEVIFRRFDSFPERPTAYPTALPNGGLIGVTYPTRDAVGDEFAHISSSGCEDWYDDFVRKLPALSEAFPQLAWSVLFLACHGGPIEARATTIQRGQTLWEERGEHDRYDRIITKALSYVGVDIAAGFFEPFLRGGFSKYGQPLNN